MHKRNVSALGHSRYEGRDYIDEVDLASDPRSMAFEVLVRRTYQRIDRAITQTDQHPQWLLFARARQGNV